MFDSPFYHLQIDIDQKCQQCQKASVTACVDCKGVFYCSRSCQSLAWKQHRVVCKEIKQKLSECNDEEQKVMNYREPDGQVINLFEQDIPVWKVLDTLPYFNKLHELIFFYYKLNTKLGWKQCLHYSIKVLKYHREDIRGIRFIVSDALLRLNEDQIAYDFIKWYIVYRYDTGYNVYERQCPYLSCTESDRSEPIFLDCNFAQIELCHLVTWVLIKYRLRAYYLTKQQCCYQGLFLGTHDRLGAASPLYQLKGLPDVLQHITSYCLGSTRSPTYIQYTQDPDILTAQLHTLLLEAEKKNKWIWRALVNPRTILSLPYANRFITGDPSETVHAVGLSLCNWVATEGAIDFLKEYVMKKYYSLDYTLPYAEKQKRKQQQKKKNEQKKVVIKGGGSMMMMMTGSASIISNMTTTSTSTMSSSTSCIGKNGVIVKEVISIQQIPTIVPPPSPVFRHAPTSRTSQSVQQQQHRGTFEMPSTSISSLTIEEYLSHSRYTTY